MKKILFVTLLLALALALITCDDGKETHTHEWEWVETTPATPTADGLETETCKTCGAESGNTRIIEQTEPTVKTFQTKDLFEEKTATIKDERTNCGKQNLEQLGIVTQIENAITAGFNGVAGLLGNVNKSRFRRVFGVETVYGVGGGVTIIVNNPTNNYEGALTPDTRTMTFHISYLQSNPADINQKIIDAVVVMSDPANFE